MDLLDHLLTRAGGIISTPELLAEGLPRTVITQAVGAGRLFRLRRGWVAAPGAPRDGVLAVRAGAQLGGLSALATHGVWRGLDTRLHLSWARHGHATGLGRPLSLDGREVVAHWRETEFDRSQPHWRVSPELALLQVLHTADREDAIATFDSAINAGLAAPSDCARVCRVGPPVMRDLMREVDGTAGSGLETRIRVRLRRAGLAVRTQVKVPGVPRIDALVGSSLAIEADGGTHESTFKQDRRFTLELQSRGFVVVRPLYESIMFGWHSFEQLVLGYVQHGLHELPVRMR